MDMVRPAPQGTGRRSVRRAQAGPAAAGQARAVFVDGMGGIGEFWGISRAMGQIWAVLYLSETPMTMDDLVAELGITKGHASTNLRALLRLGLVAKTRRRGDRKEYFSPEADLWAFARRILRERQKQEFDQALGSTVRSLALLEAGRDGIPVEEYRFLRQRLEAIHDFHAGIDQMVAAVLALEGLDHAVRRIVPGGRSRAS